MLPGIYDFSWDAGHVIFLGAFYGVVALIAGSVAIAVVQSLRDFRRGGVDSLRWNDEFRSLPASSRLCRHAMTGDLPKRVCRNGFGCGSCITHLALLEASGGPARGDAAPAGTEASIAGFAVPMDRLYHRGHTWVKPGADGDVTIGLDDMAARLIGRPDRVELPEPGARIHVNGTGWRLKKRGAEVRILAPISGVVLDRGGPSRGWYLRVRPEAGGAACAHLLAGAEVAPWFLRESERLQGALRPARLGATLADGGVPVRKIWRAIPEEDRDAVLGEMLLDP